MHFSHFTLYVFALLSYIFVTIASPVPVDTVPSIVAEVEAVEDTTVHTLQKRIDHHGRGTWFHPGMGNCGKVNKDSDLIVAIPLGLYNQNGGSNCDQYVKIVYKGKTVYGKTRDSCPSCGDGLDLSPSLFQKLAPLSVGVLDITWSFQPRGWTP